MKSLFRIVIGVAVACMVVVAATAQSHAGHEDHDTSTDDDMGVRHDATGPKDVKCALNCAELGMPVGILEEGTETIYLIIPAGHGAPKEAVVGFIGQHVTAKLMIFRNGGLNSAEVMSIAAASQPATVD
ncbi:MAG TPA: hypothetical protein DIC52_20975 [Candidatus Latescibacteria bacterium]|nr:hypothetical protein [Candidatus Latescibacterota bacterium]